MVIDNNGIHSATERRATVALEERLHTFECAWFNGHILTVEHEVYAGLWLGWERPGRGLEEIPLSAWYCRDTENVPSITLVADEPTEQGDNQLRITPRIDLRGASVSKLDIFRDRLLWGESSQAPFAVSELLCAGTNRLWGRLHYGDGQTVDSQVIETEGVEMSLKPWTLAVQGETGLPHAFRMKQGVLDFVGEGEYFLYQKIKGDFTLTCRVDHVLSQAAGADPGCWMGLLAKESIEQAGRLFGFYQTAGAGLRGSPNHADIVGTRMSRREFPKDHPWIRIERRGNVFTSYSSPDGENWTKAIKSVRPMREELFVGLIARTMPYKSRALFRARVRNITLRADPPDLPRD